MPHLVEFQGGWNRTMRYLTSLLSVIVLSFGLLIIAPIQPSFAQVCLSPQCGCCAGVIGSCQAGCICTSNAETGLPDNPKTTIGHVTEEFKKHREWLVDRFFKDPKEYLAPGLLVAMQLMTEQLTVISMSQVQIIGTFFDAKHQLETQRLFQQLTARAHKDYHPSQELCKVGTITKSLATSSRHSDLAALALSKHSVERQLLAKNTASEGNIISDQKSRLTQFIKKYCNEKDNASGLDLLCAKSNKNTKTFNKDINYTATIEAPLTLDLNFSTGGKNVSEDEEAIFALTSNLFSHELYPFVLAGGLVTNAGNPRETAAEHVYMDARALIAKRSVAQNSFSAITALKAKGDDQSQPFIYALIQEMSEDKNDEKLTADEIKELIGDKPSYFAQMEVLTKKLYQNPNFYSDLYDKPANVMRRDVAIQAATLMQKRDLYRSYLRSEMTLAVILEIALSDEQERITNEIPTTSSGGRGRKLGK